MLKFRSSSICQQLKAVFIIVIIQKNKKNFILKVVELKGVTVTECSLLEMFFSVYVVKSLLLEKTKTKRKLISAQKNYNQCISKNLCINHRNVVKPEDEFTAVVQTQITVL